MKCVLVWMRNSSSHMERQGDEAVEVKSSTSDFDSKSSRLVRPLKSSKMSSEISRRQEWRQNSSCDLKTEPTLLQRRQTEDARYKLWHESMNENIWMRISSGRQWICIISTVAPLDSSVWSCTTSSQISRIVATAHITVLGFQHLLSHFWWSHACKKDFVVLRVKLIYHVNIYKRSLVSSVEMPINYT